MEQKQARDEEQAFQAQIDAQNDKIDQIWERYDKLQTQLWSMYDKQWEMQEGGASEDELEIQ